MCLCGLRLKKHYFPQTVHYFCSSIPAFLKRVDFYKAHRYEKRGVLLLASYPVHCDWPNTSSMWQKCYAPYRILMPCPRATTQKKNPIINEVFVASDGDIITYYNGVYCLFNALCCMARHKLENELPGCESEVPDCPCKVGIAPLYRNSLWAQLAGSSQVQEIVCKMLCTHSNIWVELFWNSVVNTT